MKPTLFSRPKALLQMFATGTVLASGFFSNAVPANALSISVDPVQDATSHFFEDYTWCDAKMLGEFWGDGPGEAKVSAGKLLQDGSYHTVESKLTAARGYYGGQGLCNYSDEGFTYDDMVVVADYWGSPIYEVKTIIADKLEWGMPGAAHDIVELAYDYQANHGAFVTSVAFQDLNYSGQILGHFAKKSNGAWVELNAHGEEVFYFEEVASDPFVVTLYDSSRNMEIYLDYHFNQIQYRYLSDTGVAPHSLYGMSF